VPPLVIAHRGDSARRPENTLASFASALEVGAEVLEFDVQLTRDGTVVVIHDPAIDRTTDGVGRIQDMTLAEIRRFSAGYPSRFGDAYRGERVPTLSEVLGLIRDRAIGMIEIKPDSVSADAEGGIEAHTIAEVRKAGMESQVALISFTRLALVRCRSIAPEILRGHLFHRASVGDVLAGAREIASTLVLPEKGMLSAELFDRAREAGVKVATWVIDDAAELAALAHYDLYGIGSNRPSEMMEALRGDG
jgi:glycerophosphoryl diester phosphodiesterase